MASISQEPLRPDPRAHLKAQPALFDQRQVKPRADIRYQRGYTPERMADVRQATQGKMDFPSYGEPTAPGREPCSTCGGQGHSPSFRVTGDMLKDAGMQAHWRERGIQHNGVVASAPGQECWGCGGKGYRAVTAQTNRGMAASLDHPFYQPGGHGQRMAHEAIARSTIPTSHLEGLQSIILPGERKVGMTSRSGVLGEYTGSREKGTGKVRLFPVPAKTPKRGPEAGQRLIQSMNVPSSMARRAGAPTFVPKNRRDQVQQSETTLIHEIGHHVSSSPAGPAEEARADKYMVHHYRPDPRDVRRGQEYNPNRFTYLARMGGPYTRHQLEETPVPEPKPPKQKRVNVRRALLKDPFK